MKWQDVSPRSYTDRLEQLRLQDPYARLGVYPGAPLRDVRRAYLARLKVYHPDRADDFTKGYFTEVTKLLTDAYDEIQRRFRNDR